MTDEEMKAKSLEFCKDLVKEFMTDTPRDHLVVVVRLCEMCVKCIHFGIRMGSDDVFDELIKFMRALSETANTVEANLLLNEMLRKKKDAAKKDLN